MYSFDDAPLPEAPGKKPCHAKLCDGNDEKQEQGLCKRIMEADNP